MNVEGDKFNCPIIKIDPMYGCTVCNTTQECHSLYDVFKKKHLHHYVGENRPENDQIVAACIDLDKYNFECYKSSIHSIHKKNARRARNRRYYCKFFPYHQYIPDIHDINISLPERTGRPMAAQYMRTVEEMGGAPKEIIRLEKPECNLHYDSWWGVFNEELGRYQGDCQVNERLVAYIRLRRIGNYALYSQILGHGDYLQNGIMSFMHLKLMNCILNRIDDEFADMKSLIYGGYMQGKEGLIKWKERARFSPVYLVSDV